MRWDVIAETVAKAVVVFASTNVDDIVLLLLFFADPKLRPRAIVLGQFLGIGVLVGASAIAGALATAIPDGYLALLGLAPLGIGIGKGVSLLRRNEVDDAPPTEELARGSPILAVAAVTIANGGDNLGVYVPLFATEPGRLALYAIVFVVMTAIGCALAYRLVRAPAVGKRLQRYGRFALPIVLVVLGLHILSGARALR